MWGRAIKMLGRTIKTLGRTYTDTICVDFIGYNSNWQLHWAQKTDAVQLVDPMSQFDSFVHPFLHCKSRGVGNTETPHAEHATMCSI